MIVFPVDATRLGVMRALSVSADVDAEGVQKRRDGRPVWVVETLIWAAEGGRTDVERVKIPAVAAPELPPLAPVLFEGLTARGWSIGTRSGVSLSAASVEAVA